MNLNDIAFAHPVLHHAWPIFQSRIKDEFGLTGKIGSVHRLPAEQFTLYKKGRVLVKGEWVLDSDPSTGVVTSRDGYDKFSHHNLLPTGAIDINLFKNGVYLKSADDYGCIGVIAKDLGIEWGGNWKSLKDGPHVQLYANACLGGSIKRETGEQWQRYLVEKAGKNIGAIDGYPGAQTLKALKEVVGLDTLCPEAWKKLFDLFGPLSV